MAGVSIRVQGHCVHTGSTDEITVSLFQPRKKRARGVHTARDSLSTRRIAEQFGHREEQKTVTYQSKKSVSRTQHALEEKDRAANNVWVRSHSIARTAFNGSQTLTGSSSPQGFRDWQRPQSRDTQTRAHEHAHTNHLHGELHLRVYTGPGTTTTSDAA